MSYRPLIAVVAYHLADDRVPRWPDGGYGVPAPYLEALRRTGARTAIIAPGEDGDPAELLEPFDGLVLVGGGDVHPSTYGADPDTEHLYGVERDRDAFEIGLVHAADRLHVPTLCICRGMQIMNIAFDGTLHQHLPEMDGLLPHGVPVENTESLHPVTLEPRTLLSATTKSGPLTCSSHHHQGVDRVGAGLVVSGRSPDGLVEAIEVPVPDMNTTGVSEAEITWMLGVQWHPEETAATDPAQQSLFDAVTLLARHRGSRARSGERVGRNRPYGLSDYDERWPDRFEREAEQILAALPADTVARIDHVGSTSVPGLAAKPIIDIQLSLVSMVPRSAYVDPLVALGYDWTPDPWDDQHEYFNRSEGDDQMVHIHACEAGSDWERRHLAFRDALRSDPDAAAEYEALKRRLAADHPQDIMAYVDGKTHFVRRIEARQLGTSPQEPARRG
jgi:putative glutamine amidotransferase